MKTMRRNAETSLAWVTIAIIVANVVVFSIDVAAGAGMKHTSPQTLIALGGDVPLRTLHGEWWRAFSSMFVHAGFRHLTLNMLVLFYLRRTEREYGHAAFAVIYVVAGLGGQVASDIQGQVVSVGASGAVFGVIGAAVVAMRRSRLDAQALRRAWLLATAFILLSVIDAFRDPQIDNAGHAGGLVAGISIGALLITKSSGHANLRRTLAVAGLGVATIVAAMFGLSTVRPAPLDGPFVATFVQVERDCDARWEQIIEGFAHHSNLETADSVDRDLIALWHAMRVNLDAATPPARLATLYTRLRAYAAAREENWRDVVRFERSPSADPRVDLKIARQESAEVDRAHDAVVEELERLGYRAEDYIPLHVVP
ncbi:MAG TPA: rhomboid family intramembrane serine protease [Kofleriaceae bacterium]|nr:rhomboid family intramembrane serine protease [Kofleriaceae bacterium]